MKLVKAACICQTLHFMLKDDLERSIAARQVREEVEHYKQALERNHTKHKIVDETTVSPTRCVLTALRAAEHGRPNVPIRKRSPSQSQKTEVHAPGFLEFAKQILSKRARSARKARRRRAFFASLRDAAHAKRALSPAVFRQSRNRQDRRTAVRRIKFPKKVRACT